MTHSTRYFLGSVTAALIMGAMPASAESLNILEQRIAALEAKQNQPAPIVTETGFKLQFYGFAKLDAIHDDNYDLGTSSSGLAITGTSAAEGSKSRLHAYQSQFGIKGRQQTDMGELKFQIEGDFFGGTGGTFRLRHAYGELGGFLAGQTWSLFVPMADKPVLMDFNGVAGTAGQRVAQARYTYTFDKTQVAFSLEEDSASWNARPAIVGALSHTFDKGGVRLGLISRELEASNGDNADGWGVTLSGHAKPWEGGTLQATLTQGKGISSIMTYNPYVSRQATAGNNTIFDLDANGDPIKMTGMSIALSQNLSPTWEVMAAYGQNDYNHYAGAGANGTDKIGALHIGVRYKPVKPVVLATEFIRAERKQFDGETYKNNRLQFSAMFIF